MLDFDKIKEGMHVEQTPEQRWDGQVGKQFKFVATMRVCSAKFFHTTTPETIIRTELSQLIEGYIYGDLKDEIARLRKQADAKERYWANQHEQVLDENELLKAKLAKANAVIDDFCAIYDESDGVAGWHKNDEIAYWSELDFLQNSLKQFNAASHDESEA